MRLQRRPNGQNYAALSSAWGDYKYVSSKRWRGVVVVSLAWERCAKVGTKVLLINASAG
jgi:hypothetical protein